MTAMEFPSLPSMFSTSFSKGNSDLNKVKDVLFLCYKFCESKFLYNGDFGADMSQTPSNLTLWNELSDTSSAGASVMCD